MCDEAQEPQERCAAQVVSSRVCRIWTKMGDATTRRCDDVTMRRIERRYGWRLRGGGDGDEMNGVRVVGGEEKKDLDSDSDEDEDEEEKECGEECGENGEANGEEEEER